MNTTIVVIGAFAVGVAVGVVLDDAWDLYRADKKEHDVNAAAPADAKHRKGFSTNTLGVLLIVCCIALATSAVTLILSRNSTEKYSKCSAEWQQQFSTAYNARSDAATEVSQSVDRIMIAVSALNGDDPESVAEFKAALQQYLQVRSKQDKERSTKPLPPLPDVLCGDRSR